MQDAVITFIGAGNMASSFIGGLIHDGFDANHLWASNPSSEKLDRLSQEFSIHTTQSNVEAASHADVIVLAVKPNKLKAVLEELKLVIQERKPLIVSIVTGVREATMQNWLGGGVAIVRCMPNTPSLVSCGAAALFANPQVTESQRELSEAILRAVGLVLWVGDEGDIDIVTALSGSGVAYFFMFMDAMQKGGEKLGMNAKDAKLLTMQTVLGAARMAMETGIEPIDLASQVCAKGGTTERALAVLERNDMHKIMFDTMNAAYKRSIELAEQD